MCGTRHASQIGHCQRAMQRRDRFHSVPDSIFRQPTSKGFAIAGQNGPKHFFVRGRTRSVGARGEGGGPTCDAARQEVVTDLRPPVDHNGGGHGTCGAREGCGGPGRGLTEPCGRSGPFPGVKDRLCAPSRVLTGAPELSLQPSGLSHSKLSELLAVANRKPSTIHNTHTT